MKPAHIIAATAAGSWVATVATVLCGCLGWTGHIHPNVTILACTISGTATVCAILCAGAARNRATTKIAMGTLAKLEETAAAILDAVDRFNRDVVLPLKEAYICGVQHGQALAASNGSETVVIPRQIYTADLCTADGAITVELPVFTEGGSPIGPAVGVATVTGKHRTAGHESIVDTGNVHPLRHSRPGPRPRNRRRSGMPQQHKPGDPTNN